MTRTLATARRVLQQLSHDRRSIALIVLLPSVLLALFKYIYDGQPAIFDRVGPQMLGLFPFIVMFLVTSVTMVRERTSGTLERLLTTPLRRGELIGGYALAFGLAALVQALVSAAVAIWLLDLKVETPWAVVAVRRGRRCAGHRARPADVGVRAYGVPGRAVHAADRRPADPAVRAARSSRLDARCPALALRRTAVELRDGRVHRAGQQRRRSPAHSDATSESSWLAVSWPSLSLR